MGGELERMVQVMVVVAALMMPQASDCGAGTVTWGAGISELSKHTASPETRRQLLKEAARLAGGPIKINPSNPPGNEQIAAMYIAGILRRTELKAEILDTRGSAVVARLQAPAMANPTKALFACWRLWNHRARRQVEVGA